MVYFSTVFIHSIVFVIVGCLGLLSSILLYRGLAKKETGPMIWWICFQGMLIFHQVFFSFEIIETVFERFRHEYISMVVSLFMGIYLIVEIYFMVFIIKIYQKLEENETISSRPTPGWRVPTISELLGDEAELGQSIPPVFAIRNSNGVSQA